MSSEPPPYPRIPHLFPQPERSRDDLVLAAEDRERFLCEPVIVEEKLDGANVMLWLDGEGSVRVAGRSGIGGMDRAGQIGRLRAWAAERSDRLGTLLAEHRVLYAEWLLLTHTVHYDCLPDLLAGTDLHAPGIRFHTANERDRGLRRVGLTPVPRVFSGTLGAEKCLWALFGDSAFGSEPAEGLVLRREREGRVFGRAKVLRPGFVRKSDEQWGGTVRLNALAGKRRTAVPG